jgi:hypothetical protein
VEISQSGPVDKPAPAVRDRLPNRRPAITSAFERDTAGKAASPIGHALDLVTP